MFELAAQAASQYGPNLWAAVISGLLTGVAAAGVAWWTATHEVGQAEARRSQDQKEREERERQERVEQAARDEERRRDEIRKAVLGQFLQAAAEFNRLVTGRAVAYEQLGAYRFLASRVLMVQVLLNDEGTSDELQQWFTNSWQTLRDRFITIRKSIQPASARGHFKPEQIEEIRDLTLKLEYALTRWSLHPIAEWSTEDVPERFQFGYRLSEDEGS
ncbi:hypothetical protein [Nocardiopsis metallicus]|uniref:Putative MAPEG superfamily protein n=1 Tax=Nocardiopsis metallicus TaxID=179819 RepID=A0A840WEX8_9ACTN|nr:hypothetical protein [Nocardiopsis metallicus]MBB5494674.1 putative MAPEG superfamily protein [Nocardiopsis metallicus]